MKVQCFNCYLKLKTGLVTPADSSLYIGALDGLFIASGGKPQLSLETEGITVAAAAT